MKVSTEKLTRRSETESRLGSNLSLLPVPPLLLTVDREEIEETTECFRAAPVEFVGIVEEDETEDVDELLFVAVRGFMDRLVAEFIEGAAVPVSVLVLVVPVRTGDEGTEFGVLLNFRSVCFKNPDEEGEAGPSTSPEAETDGVGRLGCEEC